MRFSLLAALLCVGLVAASITIPLKKQQITTSENDSKIVVDEVFYAEGTISKVIPNAADIVEKITIDLNSSSNYVLSAETNFAEKPIAASSFKCGTVCATGTAPETESVSILGGKATLEGNIKTYPIGFALRISIKHYPSLLTNYHARRG